MKLILGLLLVTFAIACGQPDKTFTMPVRLSGGFYVGTDPTLYLVLPTGGSSVTWATLPGKPSVFPPDLAITNPLYRPIAWVPTFAQLTAKPTTLAGYGITDASLATHNHSTLYKAINWFPTWDEVTAKPATLELSVAIEQLGYLPVPRRTTTEINALVIPSNKSGIVYDVTVGAYKGWTGTIWKVIITAN